MNPYRYSSSFLDEPHSFNVIKPAFQVGLTLEPSTDKSISTGMYVSYLYAPTTMSKFSATGTAEFEEDRPYDGERIISFTREATFTAPKGNFNMGGFSLGFLIRIR
jgi:hypothetical protein